VERAGDPFHEIPYLVIVIFLAGGNCLPPLETSNWGMLSSLMQEAGGTTNSVGIYALGPRSIGLLNHYRCCATSRRTFSIANYAGLSSVGTVHEIFDVLPRAAAADLTYRSASVGAQHAMHHSQCQMQATRLKG
jgi:hypothetical protein